MCSLFETYLHLSVMLDQHQRHVNSEVYCVLSVTLGVRIILSFYLLTPGDAFPVVVLKSLWYWKRVLETAHSIVVLEEQMEVDVCPCSCKIMKKTFIRLVIFYMLSAWGEPSARHLKCLILLTFSKPRTARMHTPAAANHLEFASQTRFADQLV